MPITQERLMTVVDAASDILESLKLITSAVDENLDRELSDANSVIDHLSDPVAKEIFETLKGRLIYIQSLATKTTLKNSHLGGIVQGEQQYFQRMAKVNARAAHYQRRARIMKQTEKDEAAYVSPWQDQNEITEAAIPRPVNPAIAKIAPVPTGVDINSEEYKRYLAWNKGELEEQHQQPSAPQAAPEPPAVIVPLETREQKLQRTKQQNEIEALTAEKLKAETPLAAKPRLPPTEPKPIAGMRPVSYDPNVIASSLPTLEELNDISSLIGKDLL